MPDGTPTTYDGPAGSTLNPHKGVTSAGMDCLTESIPDGYGKLITHPLGLEGDINDARPANSTVLEWYYQLSARWVPKLECSEYPQPSDDDDAKVVVPEHNTDAAKAAAPTSTEKKKAKATKAKVPSAVYPRPRAMSFHNFAGPGDLNDKQSSFVFTYQVRNLLSVFDLHLGLYVFMHTFVNILLLFLVHFLNSPPRTRSRSSGTPVACTTVERCCG